MERKNAMFFKLKNDWTTRTIVEAVVNGVVPGASTRAQR